MAAQSTLRHADDPISILLKHYVDRIRAGLTTTSRTARLLAAVVLTLGIISSSYGSYKWYTKRRKEKETGRRLLRRNSGLRGKDGSRTLFVPYKHSTARVTIYPTKPTTFDAHRRLFLQPPRAAGLSDSSYPQVPPPQTRPGLNLAFLHQFLSLLNIMVPRWSSKETGLLFSHSIFLLLRTYLSLVVARLDGEIVRDLVGGKGRAFIWGIAKWLAIGGFASYTNAMIKFLQSKISIAFRTRLTRYIHDLYLSDTLTYYKLTNLDGGVGNQADQFITQDLTLFCDAAASLYSSLGKPMVDLVVFNYQLYRSLGPLALSGLLANYFATATLLRRLSPPFGKLKAVEGKREGEFRALHARLIANAEEVAFYGGDAMEKVELDKGFRELKGWMEGIYRLKIRYNMLEDFILKYSWSAFGYLITALPVFLPAWGGLGDIEDGATPTPSPATTTTGVSEANIEHNTHSSTRMRSFITNKRLMLSLADAGSRIMYSLKDLSELAGHTSRVYTLISTLHRVHASAYHLPPSQIAPYSLSDIQGTLHLGFDGVRLENVPVIAPSLFPSSGEELIPHLSFLLRPGDHLLITGPNGAGKSAVARLLAGLWPVYRGLVSRPRRVGAGDDGIMFLPQRPYLPQGTLRDQVIYPATAADVSVAGRTDAEVQECLEAAKLGYLVDREGGWDTRKEWKDVLSGGEKQRVGLARLFFASPRWAVLDEATSAVSGDVEGGLFEGCKERGITLITLSTRASLKRHHTHLLTLGLGPHGDEWDFQRIGTEQEKQSVETELQELRDRLKMVETWRRRREEIERELDRVWVGAGDVLEPPDYVNGAGMGEGERDRRAEVQSAEDGDERDVAP